MHYTSVDLFSIASTLFNIATIGRNINALDYKKPPGNFAKQEVIWKKRVALLNEVLIIGTKRVTVKGFKMQLHIQPFQKTSKMLKL